MLEKNISVSETDKQLLKTLLPLLGVALLFVFAGKFAVSQLTNINKQVSDAKKTQSILKEKVELLSMISHTSANSASIALVAFPKSNPALQVVYQLKTMASMDQLMLTNIKTSISEDFSNMTSLNTTFDITGSKDQVFIFAQKISEIAPLTFIQKIDVSESMGVYIANFTTKTYFSALPTKVPAVTSAATDLTSTEKELLNQISTLTRPVVYESLSPSVGEINQNPFGE